MIIKMRYEDKFQELEVDAGKWVNISVDDCESQEEFEKQVQEQVDNQFNKPEYNIYHRETRHLGDAMFKIRKELLKLTQMRHLFEKLQMIPFLQRIWTSWSIEWSVNIKTSVVVILFVHI